MSNKTRIITRLGYKHADFSKQGKWRADSHGALERAKNETPPSGWLDQVKILGGVSALPVKMRLNVERRREAMIKMKPAATMIHGFPRHRCHHHRHRRYRFHLRYRRRIAARLMASHFAVISGSAHVRRLAFYRGLPAIRPSHWKAFSPGDLWP